MRLLIAVFLNVVITVSSSDTGCTDRLYKEYLTSNECTTKRRCPYPGYAEYDLEGEDDARVCLYKIAKGTGECVPSCRISDRFGVADNSPIYCSHKKSCDKICKPDYTLVGESQYCNRGTLTGKQDCVKFCSQGETDTTEPILCKHGEKCIPTCKPGHHNIETEVTCNNGTFSGEVLCRKPCTQEPIEGASQGVSCNSKDFSDDTEHDEDCLPTCGTDMTLMGEAYCFDGELTSTAKCENKCPVILPNNAVLGNCPTSMDSQSSCQLACANGKIIVSGTTEATCNDGTFSTTLQCEKQCSSVPKSLESGTLNNCDKLYAGGPNCSFTCNGGYDGTGYIGCDTNDKLINTANCVTKPCINVPYYAENMKDGSCYDLMTGGSCEPECELGFHGNGERWTCSAGEWESNGFKCVPRDKTLFMYYDPSDGSFEWDGEDKKCHRLGKYAHLTVDGTIECEYCNYTKFLESYHKSIVESDILASFRHGSCCVNTHHKVCEEMLNEYKTQCESELKGVSAVNGRVGVSSGSQKVEVVVDGKVVRDVSVTFDDKTYTACTIDNVKVLWNGIHNIQEVTQEGYNTCSQDQYMGTELVGFKQSGTEQTVNVNAILGETRYFICTSHCASGAKFKINCPNN